MKQTTISFGASVRGPLHKHEGTANEDSWLRAHGSFGSLVVVCDGMGSRPKSKLGAEAACAATREAVTRWAKVDDAPLTYLIQLIEVLWLLRIHPFSPEDAATTCLFALALNKGKWIVGGIGDGLALVKTGHDSIIEVIGPRDTGFGNETQGLGTTSGIKAWRLTQLPPSDSARFAVLATDGVADDLLPEKLDAFCLWLLESFLTLKPIARWRQLAKELRAWPTPKHLDDKTLAVMSSPALVLEEMV
ncbi:MAG TPA: PP2C family serine/threonine-protein phosphatase [bacterium]|nr:PP2C family serine/threonine-protein phosphatase [bacterium]